MKNLSKHFDPWSTMVLKTKEELMKKTGLEGVRILVTGELWIEIEDVIIPIQEEILDDVQSVLSK